MTERIPGNVRATAGRVHNFIVCGVVLCAMLSSAACGSTKLAAPDDPPPPPPPPPPPLQRFFSLSGHVYEVTSGGHVPTADFPVRARVLARNCTAPACTDWQNTRTAPDGRYDFGELPEGRVVVTANTASHAQVCGTTAVLDQPTQLDVEITSRTSRQPSLTTPPLRVSGQVFRMTPTGRVGLSHAEMALELSLDASAPTIPSAFFLEVDADANGNYLACGLPANWPIQFTSGFEDYRAWHQFSADTTLDIQRRQP